MIILVTGEGQAETFDRPGDEQCRHVVLCHVERLYERLHAMAAEVSEQTCERGIVIFLQERRRLLAQLQDLAVHPRFWVPLLILTTLSVVYIVSFSRVVGWEAVFRRQMESNARIQQMPAEQREAEMRAAARMLGGELEILDFKDCQIFDSYESRVRLAQAIPGPNDPKLIVQVQGLMMQLGELQTQLELREKELQALKEREMLGELKTRIEAMIESNPTLKQFKRQLLIDITSEGLRIQIVDEQNRPMFDLAAPVVIAELGWMTMGLVDTLMVGRIGPEAIGAVGIAAAERKLGEAQQDVTLAHLHTGLLAYLTHCGLGRRLALVDSALR